MAMQMLGAGGVPLLVDRVRAADISNPHGYFEHERVKTLHTGDSAWLAGARGRAVKVVSYLLTWLPEHYAYKVVFMQRDLREIIASERAMLLARGEAADADTSDAEQLYAEHLDQVRRFLAQRPCFETLPVRYQDAVEAPHEQARRISAFLRRKMDVDAMAGVVRRGDDRRRAKER
jgi:hypothetical protein